MTKEALAVSGLEGGETVCERALELSQRGGCCLAQVRFEFGEGHLDRM